MTGGAAFDVQVGECHVISYTEVRSRGLVCWKAMTSDLGYVLPLCFPLGEYIKCWSIALDDHIAHRVMLHDQTIRQLCVSFDGSGNKVLEADPTVGRLREI